MIARYGLAARRRLGQHFLLDGNLTGRIARAAGDLTQANVIETGPGPGGLTRALLSAGVRQIIAIERDRRCLGALEELAAAYPGRLRVIAGDALEIEAADLAREFDREAALKIVANLPYNIATPLLFKWMARVRAFESLTLMFQKEVAARITATPRTKDYGRLSVSVQRLCEARALFDIPPRAFTPPPKVTSTVVGLTPRPAPLAEADQETLAAVTAAAFGQRRKMLRSSLKSLGVDVTGLLSTAGIDPTARAEELSVEAFCALARTFKALAADH